MAERPAVLSRAIPDQLYVYTDLCESYAVGDVHASLLRIVSLDVSKYIFGSNIVRQFGNPHYIPLVKHQFQTIVIDIRDQFGIPIPFEYGTLTVTLHFNAKKILNMSLYLDYYDNQLGGGSHVKTVFVGSPYQRGRGVGGFLGGLLRRVMPYLVQGMKTVGREALRSGLDVFDDVTSNKTTFKDSIRERGRESGQRLKRKAADKIINLMKGQGYKSKRVKRKPQSQKKRRAGRKSQGGVRKKRSGARKGRKTQQKKKSVKKTKKKSLRDISDIFGPR